MKKKILAAAIAGCLATPAAYAAIDDAGMKYTSASEGFYGSLRFALSSSEDNDASVGHESSRLGVQGDVDVGHGNTAFYRGEWRFRYTDGAGSDGAPDNGSGPFQTRLAYVGMKGAYGSVRFGQIWSADYDYVTSFTDVTNNVTGNLAPRFRVGNALRYDSPDIKGFNFSIQLHSDDQDGRTTGAVEASGPLTDAQIGDLPATIGTNGLDAVDVATYLAATPDQRSEFNAANGVEGITDELGTLTGVRTAANAGVTDPDDGNEFDRYVLGAAYSIRGLNLGATYVNVQAPDGKAVGEDDETSWGIGGSYGQDNWKVAYLYWDVSDYRNQSGDDLTGHSFSGQVSFDKVTLRAVYDTQEYDPSSVGQADTDAFTLEAQYSFSSQARAYVNYQNVDREAGAAPFFGGNPLDDDGNPRTASDSDTFYVAYRVDF